MDPSGDPLVLVRTYRRTDDPVCRRLFVEGLVGGKIADGDTGADIDCIEKAYLARPDTHFWVAEVAHDAVIDPSEGATAGPGGSKLLVVGMVGVQHHGDGTAEIRRLRVDGRYRRRGIGSALLEQALSFCREQHYIRVILDTFMERDPAVKLFEKFSFKHGRTRKVGDKDLLYFYLDLYGSSSHRRTPKGQ